MNIAPSPLSLRQILKDGQAVLDAQHSQREAKNAGLLRAGSAGCVVDGAIYGECARVGHLRHVGLDKHHDLSTKLMFQAGEGNEDLWEKVLVPGWYGAVVRHAEVRKVLPFGEIMGHPDIVLAENDGTWNTVLELKLISATYTAIQRGIYGQPDDKHLIQALVYMWMTGRPVILCYTNRSNFKIEFDRKKLGIDKIEPYYRLFYLAVDQGALTWRDEFDMTTHHTPLTVDGVEQYYKLVAEAGAAATLPDRPVSVGYNRCQTKYCVFADACDRWEASPKEWLVEARAAAE